MTRVLILEDDVEFAALLVESLTLEGHIVDLFTNATDALKAFREGNYDIIISDVFVKKDGRMTRDGGIRFVSAVKQIHRSKVPILAISGGFTATKPGNIEETLRTVGADAVLAKPFHPEDLLNLMSELTKPKNVYC